MTNAEKAIRNALLKIDTQNSALRQRVYESAWNAHERALANNRTLSDTDYMNRRKELTRIIENIEKDFSGLNVPEQNTNIEFYKHGPEDEISIVEEDDNDFQSPYQASQTLVPRNRTRTILISLIALACFVFISFVSWAFYNSMKNPNDLKKNTPNNPTTQVIQNPPSKPTKVDDGWVTFFDPSNIETLATKGAASADFRNDMGIPAVFIFANSPNDAVIFNIGEGVLMKLRGKKALINIVTKSVGKDKAQLSLTCDLGTENDCGRRRFEVANIQDNLVFEVNIPQTGKTGGKLYLTSDLLGEGNAIYIYSISIKAIEQ